MNDDYPPIGSRIRVIESANEGIHMTREDQVQLIGQEGTVVSYEATFPDTVDIQLDNWEVPTALTVREFEVTRTPEAYPDPE